MGHTPLYSAAREGHAKAAKALVALGADKQAKTAKGATALHVAAIKGQAEAVKALVALGSDKQAKGC